MNIQVCFEDHSNKIITLPQNHNTIGGGTGFQLRIWSGSLLQEGFSKGHVDRTHTKGNLILHAYGDREELLKWAAPFLKGKKKRTLQARDHSLCDIWE